MASGWVKSLHCKSRAFDDVYQPYPKSSILAGSSSCRKSAQTLRDVVEVATQKARKPRPGSDPLIPPAARQPAPALRRSKTEPGRVSRSHREPVFPALTELPEGHPSRNVVEIIFHTGWTGAFPGRVEMIFKVQNGPRAAAHFEEYREAVRSRAARSPHCPGDEDARCAADGNELMRFRCMGPAGAAVDNGGSPCGAWAGALPGSSGGIKGGRTAICTFSGSGRAHESAGGGRGRRAMKVCRVVAGRVGFDPFMEGRGGYDSVSGENGELVVFDSRAVLPCFLIIYRL